MNNDTNMNHMKDRTLLIIALICSIIGLAVLFIISKQLTVEVQPIEKISLFQDKDVTIQGKVKRIIQKQDTTIVEVGYDTSINVVLFEHVYLKPGDKVTVTGKVEEYNGRLEIVGEKLTVSQG